MVMYNGERRIDRKSHQQVIQEVVPWEHSAVESFAIHANLRDLIDVSRSMKFNLALRIFFYSALFILRGPFHRNL